MSLLEELPEEGSQNQEECQGALSQAQLIAQTAMNAGFNWSNVDEVWGKFAEERGEFEQARGTNEAPGELGDMLFCLVCVAIWEGLDAEAALLQTCEKFCKRWNVMEETASEQGRELGEQSKEELQHLWQEAKRALRERHEVS